MRDRSATRPPSRARSPVTPTRPLRPSPSARTARPVGADSTKPDARSWWATGAPWIWNTADECFPDAIQIVDLFHAKGDLWEVARQIYGAGSDLAEQWAKQRRDELDEGQIDDILVALRLHADNNDAACKGVDFIITNRERMNYPKFRAQGLCTSSGVVEAGCKTAIGARLKRAGMHWTVAGADAIIALRCCQLSGRFEDFWERRAAAATGTTG